MGHGFSVACDQIVDDYYFPPGISESVHDMAADISGAAGNKRGARRHRHLAILRPVTSSDPSILERSSVMKSPIIRGGSASGLLAERLHMR